MLRSALIEGEKSDFAEYNMNSLKKELDEEK